MSHSSLKKMEERSIVIPLPLSSMEVHYYSPNITLIARSFWETYPCPYLLIQQV
jgi:hypothetical protein